MSLKVYPCEIILSGENVQNACNIVELLQVKSKEIHSIKYQISIGQVDMGRCVCHELSLTTHKKKTKKKTLAIYIYMYIQYLGRINTRLDTKSNISVGCHSFGYIHLHNWTISLV